MIRRKSTQARAPKDCSYFEQMQHERSNQFYHEQRQSEPLAGHDPTPCWCCCDDCGDLTWYYTPRKGVWWDRGGNGGLLLMQETCDESPGSPAISPSWSKRS